jgi:sulfite reductase alpha subunit-like flavoprotein
MSSVPRMEPLLVLYGSQMGNSEQAAKEFCKQLDGKLTPDFFLKNGLSPIQVETTCIQLDDFLEVRHAAYTKALVIFVSSYGVGQAPLGAYRFRSFAEALLAKNDDGSSTRILEGLRYAICGLGECVVDWVDGRPSRG